MDQRIRFVIRLKDGESMAALCREFQISRKTGYKIFERYEECGLEGLTDRARRPHRYANQLPEQIEAAIVAAKRESVTIRCRKLCKQPPTPMTTASGSSASCNTISVISIWRKKLCSPYSTPAGEKCYLCLRYILFTHVPGPDKTKFGSPRHWSVSLSETGGALRSRRRERFCVK